MNRPNPNKIISVYRPRVDECERLWFVDSGVINTSGKKKIMWMTVYHETSEKLFNLLFQATPLSCNVRQSGWLIWKLILFWTDMKFRRQAAVADLPASQLMLSIVSETLSHICRTSLHRKFWCTAWIKIALLLWTTTISTCIRFKVSFR